MWVDIGGRRLFFDVEGIKMVPDGANVDERPTLILIHGAPGLSDHMTFKPHFSKLAEYMQLIYLDLAGCGRSDEIAPTANYSLDGWADDIVAFCSALSIEKPFVLGVSGGGMVVQSYAIRHSDHCAGVVMANTQAYFDPARAVKVFNRLGGAHAGEIAEKFLTRVTQLEEVAEFNEICGSLYNRTPQDPQRGSRMIMRERVATAFHRFGDGIWHEMDMREKLTDITCPVLLLAGEDDPITPAEDSDDMAATIAPEFLTYARLADCGHGNWLDKPDESFDTIHRFVAQNAS